MTGVLAGSNVNGNRYDSSARVNFCSLSNVRDALKNYAYENVKESHVIFLTEWYDDNRLF